MSSDDLEGGTNNLREIQRIIADGVEDQVLQLVDHTEQVFSEGSHSCECVCWWWSSSAQAKLSCPKEQASGGLALRSSEQGRCRWRCVELRAGQDMRQGRESGRCDEMRW
jgi:hypothetical protein